MPLLVDSVTGRLLVDTEANLTADLTLIESKMDTANGIATGAAADTALIKAQLASGSIAVTGGGGGGGGASAAYNATLPTYTSGASSTLQTDVNGKLITTGTLTDTQLRASALPVSLASVPSHAVTNAGTFAVQPSAGDLTSGSQTTKIVNGANTLAVDSAGAVTANTAPAQTYTYTFTGAVASASVLIGPIDCSQFKELTLHSVAIGTGGNAFTVQASNDSTNWINLATSSGAAGSGASTLFATSAQSAGVIICYPTYGSKFVRIISGLAVTAGTTTCVAQFSQMPSPKAFVYVGNTVTVNPANSSNGFVLFNSLISSAGTNSTLVKTNSAAIGTCVLTNTTASFKFVKFFNKATAPTVGTDTPIIQFPIPPNSSLDISMSYCGMRFVLGLGYVITGGAALLDTTSVAAGDVLVNLSYF